MSDSEKNNEQKDEEHVTFTISLVKETFTKVQNALFSKEAKTYITLLLILIPVLLTIYVRTLNMSWPITDEWAQSTVLNYYQNQMRQQVTQQYPNLPAANREQLVQENVQQFMKQNKAQVDQQIASTSADMKAFFQDENGFPYMPDIDTYAHLRYVRNLVEKGHHYDELINGLPADTYMVAPLGLPNVGPVLHNYALFVTYEIVHFLNSKATIMYGASFFSIFLTALATIPAFFIGRRLSNNVGGFFAAMMVAVSPLFMDRGLWGHIDTDVYNIFFPLLITWLFIEMFEAKTTQNKFILSAVTGFSIGLYSFAWSGWWYVFDFLFFAGGVYFLYKLFEHVRQKENPLKHKQVQILFLMFLILFVFTGIFVTLFQSFDAFLNPFLGPLDFATIKSAAKASLWPNVYTTVAELNPTNFQGVMNAAGGKLLFVISVFGILFAFTKRDEHHHFDIKYSFLLAAWYVAVIFASFRGVRFTLLLLPPFAIAFGTALGYVYKYVTQYFAKEFDVHKIVTGTVIIIAFLFLLVEPMKVSYSIATHDLPIMNDAWYTSLSKINKEAAPDAIINSWWDFGHHFKYVGNRRVTFDGASQNTPQAHWIGRFLLTSNEKEAVGILRMLDCGGNTAAEVLDKEVNDLSHSVKLLYGIFPLDKKAAKKYLVSHDVSEKTAEQVLAVTHCAPPENYFITSDDMIGKAGVWAHFGSWDFDRADIWLETRFKPKEEAVPLIMTNMNISQQQAEQLYSQANSLRGEGDANQWIAPWPSFGGIAQCTKKTEVWFCDNSVSFSFANLANLTVSTERGTFPPQRFSYFEGNALKEVTYPSSPLPFEFAFSSEGDRGLLIIANPPLATSMFARLYFFNGKGLSHFTLFAHDSGFIGTNVYVWKVLW